MSKDIYELISLPAAEYVKYMEKLDKQERKRDIQSFFEIISPSGKTVTAKVVRLITTDLEIPLQDDRKGYAEIASRNRDVLEVEKRASAVLAYQRLGVEFTWEASKLKKGDIDYSTSGGFNEFSLVVRVKDNKFRSKAQLLNYLAPSGWIVKPTSTQPESDR